MSEFAETRSQPFGAFERTLAWRYLRARREHGGASMIAIISFVGIALAVAALIVTMSLMTGFRETLTNSLIGGQGHILIGVNDLSEEDALTLADEISGLPEIASVTPIMEAQALATGPISASGVLVRGVRAEDLSVYPSIQATLGDSRYGAGKNGGNTILIGTQLARKLGAIPGETVTLLGAEGVSTAFGATGGRRKAYEIGGLIRTGSFELDNAYVFMPLQQAQLFFNQRDHFQLLDVRLDDYRRTEIAAERIRALVGRPLFMQDWKQRNASYIGALRTESGVMRIIMLVLITITALNIITGVVMLVKNKARDIAILRTIGTSQGAIMRIFVAIGASLGATGALTGLALGVLMVVNIDAVEGFLSFATGAEIFPAEVYGLDQLPARLNMGEALFTTAWAVTMSILVTLYPAWNAAKTDPVDALRFE